VLSVQRKFQAANDVLKDIVPLFCGCAATN